MTKICTSLEQSKKLIELGIDVSTADMCWCSRKLQWGEINETIIAYPMLHNQEKSVYFKYSPAWSLTALLDLPPKGEDNNIDLCFGGYNGEEYIDEWFCTFEDNKEPFEFHTCNNKDKLDATFKIIVWLKENGKI